MKAGVEPAEGRDLVARCAASARPARRCRPRASSGSTSTLGPDTWLFSTSGGTDVCTAFVGGVPLLPVYRGRAAGPRARRRGRGLRRGRQRRHRRGRRARDHRADAVDAGLLLGRRRRRALPRVLLRHVPRRLAPRRLDPDHRARHRGHLRPLGLDDQPRRHPHGHGGDLPRRARARRDHRRARRRHPARGRRELDAAVRRAARGRRARRRPREGDRASASARTARRATCPTRSSQVDEVPRTLSGKVLEVPVKQILMGDARRQGGQPRLAPKPRIPRLFRGARGRPRG